MTYSQDFGNAAWTIVGAGTKTGNYAPNNTGATTAGRVQLTAGTGVANDFRHAVVSATGAPVTFGIWVKANSANSTFRLELWDTNAGSILSSDIVATSEWTLHTVSRTPGATYTIQYAMVTLPTSGSAVDVLVANAGAFNQILTASQILNEGGIPLTTTAAASNPNAGRYSWQFAGAQSMALGSVPFQMADDFCFGVAFKCDSAATYRVAINPGYADASNYIILMVNAPTGYVTCESAGTPNVTIAGSTSVVGACVVASVNKTGSTRTLMVNGVVVASSTTPQTASTYTTAAIGVKGSANGPFLGAIGNSYAIKGTVSAAEQLAQDRLLAQSFPNGPTF